ncbi:GNAT family N-acetyltransferase [Aureispira anguillae]|uniref:GNAT family N-acetyltransferase n=1 Tax=Aureispira anguillae TaxID=2864201 RepID=A0A915YF15_9BACT|nr:GNAT family N-acetyltransferase [Aureispira anguillae]BDS11933.1 GNAT family N-acetyltransferase [Aureispira anguillae]
MNIISVMFASPAYDELVAMRINTLYEPLNAEITIEDFAEEYKDVHLVVYNNQNLLIGGVVAKVCEEEDEFLNKRKICLLRQVVVKKDLQGLGVGRDMLASLEKMLIDKGYKEIRLYAHVGALDFYAKLGYVKHGKEFTGNGIKQHIMKKKIQKKSTKLDKLEAEGTAY